MSFNAWVLAATLALAASACSKRAPSAPSGPPAPTLTSISPTSGVRGTTVLMTFTGQNFVVGSTQVVATAGLVGMGVTGASTTSITENVLIDPSAPLGDAEFAVTTGVAHSDPLVFTVFPPAPTLTGVTPSAGAQGATVAVTLTGTNFIAGGTTVSVNGIGVTTNSVVVTSGTSLTVNLVIAADATPGADTFKVTTAGGVSGTQPFVVDTSAPLTSRTPRRS